MPCAANEDIIATQIGKLPNYTCSSTLVINRNIQHLQNISKDSKGCDYQTFQISGKFVQFKGALKDLPYAM